VHDVRLAPLLLPLQRAFVVNLRTSRSTGTPRGSRLAMVAVVGMLVAFVLPSVALAQDGQANLALRVVGQSGSYFDLTMRAGETRKLDVEIANAGDAAIATRTYASDVYTIINGGFGARLRDEPQTGMTDWLDYPTEVLQLPAGKGVHRTFAVAVPLDAGPGEYISCLVLENDQPTPGSGAVALNQVIRQAVAVVVTVPGQRSPALAIGEATHKVVAGRSVVAVAVENTGNVRLKPLVSFTLIDAAGAQVSQASVQMDSFYARTKTYVEVPIAALLLPGTYTVRLTLDDVAQGVRADATAIALVVETPAAAAAGESAGAGLTEVIQAPGQVQVPLAVLGLVLGVGLVLGGLAIGLLMLVLRHRRRTKDPEW
jgi:hypothetical protein